jgi:hypothetical protein
VRVSSAANPAGTLSQPLLLSVKAGEGVDLLAGFLGGDGYADGVGSMARFGLAASLARDAAGNLYVAEGDTQVIRKISPDGVVSTLAGLAKPDNNTQYEAVDGTGAAARFRSLCVRSRHGCVTAICTPSTLRCHSPDHTRWRGNNAGRQQQ